MANQDIRLATLADAALLLAWVNTDDSLKWKKNTKNLISTDEHLTWLKKKVILFTWIFMLSQKRGGSGLASFALNESISRYTKPLGSNTFCAIVNTENEMSEKLFLKMGFIKRKITGLLAKVYTGGGVMDMDKIHTVAAIMAHPDDEVLGCGGSLARLSRSGASVHISILATGLTSRGPADKAALLVLKDQARAACYQTWCSNNRFC